jgi:hypothetical protein
MSGLPLRTALFAMPIAIALALPASSKEPFAVTFDGPYTSRAMVTGTRPETRPAGFADCLDDVLVKVSGNPALIGDRRLKPYERQAGQWVEHYSYHDQLEGIPIHDEQGTRDRAFDLVCEFKSAAIDRILHKLGEVPWKGPRPKLAVFAGVSTARGPFVLASDGERGVDQRIAFATAANKRGLVGILPSSDVVDSRKIDFHKLDSSKPIRLDLAAKAAGGDLPLWGTLVWKDKPAGWKTQWSFGWRGHVYRWVAAGISFDEAFRRGFEGAAQIMSGHGAPG